MTFYDRLAGEYEARIRQLVPRYDELSETVVEVLAAEGPALCVEIGPGIGETAALLLERCPATNLVAVEASSEMAARAREGLAPFGSRARVVHADVRDFALDDGAEAVYASIVLHNLPPDARQRLLETVLGWLRPGRLFVWAEFVRFADPRRQAAVAEERRRFAAAAGCPPDVLERNFRKEAEEDFPPTLEELLESGRRAGFDPVDVVWAHDAFVVATLRAPAS